MKGYDLSAGKLDYTLLRELLAGTPLDDRTVIGPKIGEDAAVVDMGDRYLVIATDPITFATDLIGWYAVQVNANDIATMGAKPRWFLATILLPEGLTDEKLVRGIFRQVQEACRQRGVALIGGHTEITPDLPRPIVIGAMVGEVSKGKLVTSGGAKVGDVVLVTKGVPIEGASIIAREREGTLRKKGVPEGVIIRAQRFLFEPGISVVKEALTLCETVSVHALHDPTEGGLATGLWEIAEASGVVIEVEEGKLPILPEGQTLCSLLGLDPLGTIASGALVACIPGGEVESALSALKAAQIPAFVIGHVTGRGTPQVWLRRRDGTKALLPLFAKDEIVKVFKDA